MHLKLVRMAEAFALALASALVLLPATVPASAGGYACVAPGGSGCASCAVCRSSIQAVVDMPGSGADIRVAAGTYTDIHQRAGITQVVYISETVTIRGGYSTTDWETPNPDVNVTTLNAGGLGRVLVISGTGIVPTIEGLRITGGDATGLGSDSITFPGDSGGGVYIYQTAASISNCEISDNTASTADAGYAGGVYIYEAAATISNCVISDNTASTASGGFGGGLFLVGGSPILNGNTVRGNVASATDYGVGGGINFFQSNVTLSGNVIVSNTATLSPTATGLGGGMTVESSSRFTLTNNVLAANHANSRGSGLNVALFAGPSSMGRLIHTTIADNHGSGDGVYVDSSNVTLVFTNTIIAGNSVGITGTGGIVTMTATLWHGNGSKVGGATAVFSSANVPGDPAFLDTAALNYHLGPRSKAIDAGVDAGVYTDMDGDTRPVDGNRDSVAAMDLGADEARWLYGTYLPLVMRN